MSSLNNPEQLKGLISTLEFQETVKHDVVANSKHNLFFYGGLLHVKQKGQKDIVFHPTKHFHSQVQEKLEIPAGYYKKMLEDATQLLDTNLNHWLKAEERNFLVRTFKSAAKKYKNTARAFLSDRYSMIDNYQVLMEALESIKQTGLHIDVVNAELSDTRMYLKVICPDIEVKATKMLRMYREALEKGAGVVSGFTLSNSEVGAGSFKISPRGLILACKNGLINTDDELKSIHLGAKMEQLGFDKNKAVMNANLKLIREQVKHAVKIFLSKEYLTKLINVYSNLAEPKIQAPVDKVIEVVGREYSITEERKANILKYFIEGGDTRRMGLSSAMTRECQDLTDPDLKNETEVASFEVLKNFVKIEAAAMKLKRSKN